MDVEHVLTLVLQIVLLVLQVHWKQNYITSYSLSSNQLNAHKHVLQVILATNQHTNVKNVHHYVKHVNYHLLFVQVVIMSMEYYFC